ncbi:hypothetical protein SKAU_G00353830 [Synaphobranchus kaupii]|uniref:Uncharacterized protein n=1 Tax=Synaphobranchus kaupii TaxID=118154 RepID=A0A9Q1EL73_SYNKA|nr:hypothetical protein SKAU_G00353830 [Synaphobranchus kaupii]
MRIVWLPYAGLCCGFVETVDNMKYQKYITVMQMAMGVTASNKDNCIPQKRTMWVPPSSDAATAAAPPVSVSQGKPSLRRIKGRIHRSKSLDSIDLLDSNLLALANARRQITGRRSAGFTIIHILTAHRFVLSSWAQHGFQVGLQSRGVFLRSVESTET